MTNLAAAWPVNQLAFYKFARGRGVSFIRLHFLPGLSEFEPHPSSSPEMDGRFTHLESALDSALTVASILARQMAQTPSLHSGFQPGDPNPDLFTAEEAALYLKLDSIDIKNPDETLMRYRKLGHLKGTQISKRVFYLRRELDEFLKRMTEVNPR